MLSVSDLLDVHRNNGLEECVKFTAEKFEQCTCKENVPSHGEIRKIVSSTIAKYKNLRIHQHNTSAAKEMETFLRSSIESRVDQEQENKTGSHTAKVYVVNCVTVLTANSRRIASENLCTVYLKTL